MFSAPAKGGCHGMECVTSPSPFQYTLVLVGIAAIFIEWFSRKK